METTTFHSYWICSAKNVFHLQFVACSILNMKNVRLLYLILRKRMQFMLILTLFITDWMIVEMCCVKNLKQNIMTWDCLCLTVRMTRHGEVAFYDYCHWFNQRYTNINMRPEQRWWRWPNVCDFFFIFTPCCVSLEFFYQPSNSSGHNIAFTDYIQQI